MTRRTKAQWEALIEAHAQSGLTAASFCREHKINAKYFSLHRRQCADEKEQSSRRFIAVSIAEVSQGSTVYAVAFNEQETTIMAESSNGLGRAWAIASAH
jgi:hypothetical protein